MLLSEKPFINRAASLRDGSFFLIFHLPPSTSHHPVFPPSIAYTLCLSTLSQLVSFFLPFSHKKIDNQSPTFLSSTFYMSYLYLV